MSVSNQNAEAFSIDNTSITTSTYTYSNWLRADADEIAVLYRAATITATSLTITIQGRHPNTYTHPASIYKETIVQADAQAVHSVYRVVPKFKEIRIGAKIDTSATPNNFYAGIVRTEYNS